MIRSIRHQGLKLLYEKDDASKLSAEYVNRILLILAALDTAKKPHDLNIHTFHLHALKGDLKGWWGVTVRGNWRVVFRFDQAGPADVDLVDYH